MLQHQLTVMHLWWRCRGRKGQVWRRGSVPGRLLKKERDVAAALLNIRKDYFGMDGAPPICDETYFKRPFHVQHTLYEHLRRREGPGLVGRVP